MDAAVSVTPSIKQTTMAAGVLRIILDEFAVLDDRSNLGWFDHPLGPCHLPNCVRQEEQAVCSGASDLVKDRRHRLLEFGLGFRSDEPLPEAIP